MNVLSWLRSVFSTKQAPTMLGVHARDKALAVLQKNGLQAFYYMPASGIEDRELAKALCLLGDAGFIITNQNTGDLTGCVVAAKSNSQALAERRRAQFRVI